MKQIFLVRHAKSDWNFAGLTDYDRPLSERGHHDAPKMSQLLSNISPKVDALISSTAQRAFTTAQYFAKALHIEEQAIVKEPSLYHASESSILKTIQNLDNTYNTVCLFSHNPGISDLVATFLTKYLFAEIPTCGIVKLVLRDNDWKNFNVKNVTLESYWFPKDVLEEYAKKDLKV